MSQTQAPPAPSSTTVLVTGGSGFVGSHCVHQLLAAGYNVRTTVRSLSKADQVRKQVTSASDASAKDRLKLYEAELLSDAGWAEAVKGSDYVLHVASPFPLNSPKDENELIRPAVEGTLRLLRFAEQAGVKRVVLTSSYVAVGYGHSPADYASKVMDETYWTNVDSTSSYVTPYIKSKALAERAAWDFVKSHPALQLATVNPVAIFGPLLPGTKDIGTSIGIVQLVISGGMPAAPCIKLGAVDVRDVAALHLAAMTNANAAGKRFLAIAGNGEFISLQDIGKELGHTVRSLPDWLTRAGAFVSSALAALVSELGLDRMATNEQARSVLGYQFRSWQESVHASAESLKKEGFVK